jgi:Family of unknown function (DUF5317)
VFILASIPVGIVVGWLLGGRLAGLASIRIHWAWLALLGLVVQVLLFTDAGGDVVGSWVPAVYVASNLVVLAAVVRNITIPGVWIIVIGAGCNLAAIVANGGLMPADPAALATAGFTIEGVTNSVVLADPALRPLTDIFAIPAGVPLANVFSVGDVLIALGVVVTIALAMRRGREPRAGEAGGPL